MNSKTKKILGYLGAGVIIIISIILRLINIDYPIEADNHAFRQTQTAITVQWFMKEGIGDILKYPLPLFGGQWTAPLEFPLYQLVVYSFMKMFSVTNVSLACRVVSVISFYASALALFLLVKKYFAKWFAWLVTLVYIMSPFTIYWSRAALIDYMATAFALFYILFMIRWFTEKKTVINFTAAMLTGIAGYLCKSTAMFPAVFLLAVILSYELFVCCRQEYVSSGRKFSDIISSVSRYLKKNIGSVFILAILCLIPAIVGFVWLKYTDAVKSTCDATVFLVSDNLKEWNYGTWPQKTTYINWLLIANRTAHYYSKVVINFFVLYFLAYLFVSEDTRSKVIGLGALLGVFGTIFVLFNLYKVHDYYMISLTPYGTLLVSYCILTTINFRKKADEKFSEGFLKKAEHISVRYAALILCVIYAGTGVISTFGKGVNCLSYLDPDYDYTKNIGCIWGGEAEEVKNICAEDEYIITIGFDWSPVQLYALERKGFMVRETPTEKSIEEMSKDQYKYMLVYGSNQEYYDEIINNKLICHEHNQIGEYRNGEIKLYKIK